MALLLLQIGVGATLASAQVDRGWVQSEMDTWYRAASRNAPGDWGIAVADQTGRILWAKNPDDPLVAASTVKIFTTGFARAVLGPAARRPTRVVGAGHVAPETGAWVGSWGLELNGDPSLERGPEAGPTLYDLALQLASAGVRKLTGPLNVRSVDGPAEAVYPAVWSRRHWGRLFAPLIGPVTLNENVIWLTVAPGAKVGAKPRIVGEAPDGIASLVTISAKTVAGRRSRLSLRARNDGGWKVTGTIGVRARPRRFTAVAYKPQVVLEAAWAKALAKAGITWDRSPYVGEQVTASPRVLAEVSSPILDSLASEINRRSLNYAAELLLQWAGGRESGAERLQRHVQDVTGMRNGITLVDGSGLSYDDRVAPAVFIAYLARFPNTPEGRNFPQLLPANGAGTLRRLSTGFPAEGVVRAKTGTLQHVSNVVGYLGRPEGTLLIALMYNGKRPAAARQAQWRLFRQLGGDGVIIPSDSLPEALIPRFGSEAEGEAADSLEAAGDSGIGVGIEAEGIEH